MADDFKNDVRDTVNDVRDEARGTIDDVRSEAREVVQEARAAVTGQRLDSAQTVGGAGYRADNKTSSGKAVASLVLGILSLVCAFFGYSTIIGLIMGIIGVALGAKARKESQTGLATGGFVCSILGLVFCGIGLVCAIACVGALGAAGAAGAFAS